MVKNPWHKRGLQILCKKGQVLHFISPTQVHTILTREVRIQEEHIMCEEENDQLWSIKDVEISAFIQ
jgi:hypothetical protein